MDIKAFPALIVGVVVALVLAGAVLPVFAETTSATDKFTNKGAFFVEIDPTDTYTIKYDKAVDLGVVYINDKALNVPFSTGYTILAIDNAILRLQSGDNTVQYKGDGHYITGILKLDITVANGAISGIFQTGTSGGVDSAWPDTAYTTAFIASPDPQDYVMTEYNTVAKMNGDSIIKAFGQTQLNTTSNPQLAIISITGNIDDGVNVSVLNSSTGAVIEGAEVSDLQINHTAVNNYINLYDLTSITFKVTYDSTVTAVTYSAYVVPSEVTAEKSVHPDGPLTVILNVLPLLAIAGLVTGAVVWFINRKG